jgi:hypothetical protein
MSRKEKQPWNPFPLAVLNVEGITRGAKHILTVLAARSNWKGETCVGHRRLTKDCQSSKQYVSDALKELYAKGLVADHPRTRHKGEADWRVISQSVLQSRITKERDQSYPVGQVSPTDQDFHNPTQQGETLQIKQELNLADHSPLNLADENLNNNNQPVVVVDPQTPTEVKNESLGLVSGYTPEQIASHAEACKFNPWVHANDSPNARKRPAFVAHLMTIDPPRKPLASKPVNPNCNRCHGATYGSPTWEPSIYDPNGEKKPFCADCMKLPQYRRHEGERSFMKASNI